MQWHPQPAVYTSWTFDQTCQITKNVWNWLIPKLGPFLLTVSKESTLLKLGILRLWPGKYHRVCREFLIVNMHTQLLGILRLHTKLSKQRMVIASAEVGRQQNHDIGPWGWFHKAIKFIVRQTVSIYHGVFWHDTLLSNYDQFAVVININSLRNRPLVGINPSLSEGNSGLFLMGDSRDEEANWTIQRATDWPTMPCL